MASRKEGTTLGPYRILEQVGQGGMATVYKAYQPSMDRTIALKILPAYYAQDPRFVERFKREARTIARLEHKNILPVHDFGEENGITYLVMRYLDGGTLKDMLALGRLTVHDAVEIITQICAALDYAHRQGVVHRDVKPANIMVDRECSAYLTDFGIAKVLEGVPGLTETGAAVGTPAYMAPEQALGKPVDARTDIYALGVILYEMILGRPPFQADTPMAVALAHIHEPLPLPRQIDPSVSEEIENVILKALAKDPDDRYQTASEMAGALKEASAQAGATSASSTLRSLATQAQQQIASQTLKVSPEMFAQAYPTVREAAPQPQRGLSPFAIGGIAAGVVVVLGIVGAIIVLVKPGGAATGPIGTSTEPARASTESVSATVEPTSLPYIYDSFDNPAYDGSFDPSLWLTRDETSCVDSQMQGSRVVSNDSSDKGFVCEITASRPIRVSPAELGTVQARLKISQTSAQGGSNTTVTIMAFTPNESDQLWQVHCGLAADQAGVRIFFHIWNRANNSYSVQDSSQREWPAASDRWYTIQVKLDPATMAATCLVDGQLLASVVPDNAIGAKDQLLQRSLSDWRSEKAVAVSHADDFTILPPGQ